MPPPMNLPAYEYPRNALVNFAPINDAIDTNRANALANRRADMEGERLAMDRTRLGMEQQRFNEQQQEAIKQRLGNLALLTLAEKDPTRQAENWSKVVQTHPGASSLDPKYHDPATGPLAVLADARMAQHYLDYQIRKASEARAAAAESRAAGLYPLQKQSAEIEAALKQRELENPTEKFQAFPEGSTVIGQRGGVSRIVQNGVEKPPAEHVAKASNFAARMVEAERNVRKVLDGVDPVAPGGEAGKKFDATNAGILATSALPEAARNLLISKEHQQYRQAAEQWIRAFLRKESGAAIGKDEFARDFVVYFPQPGDRPEVVEQKQAARAAVMHGMASEAGNYFSKTNPDYAKHLDTFRSGGRQIENGFGWSARKID